MKSRPSLVFLLAIFFASGFSSLVFQVSWQRILTLYYSVENISTTLIVSVYMMGLGLGAIFGGYLADRVKNRMRFYLGIELLIGLFGCISIPFLEFLGRSTAGSNYLVSFFYMFAFLSLPTFLMGTTLPLLTKVFNRVVNDFLHSMSYLYFINTLGAAVGALLSSYILISFFGLDISIYVASAINVTIAVAIYFYKNRLSDSEPVVETEIIGRDYSETLLEPKLVYGLVFITGFIAIGYEIVWFRIIGTLVKASPYAFSSVLFVYLLGIALGSFFMNRYLRKYPSINRKDSFFLIQFAIAVFVLFSVATYYNLIDNVEFFSRVNSLSFNTTFHPYVKTPSIESFSIFLRDVFLALDVIIWPLLFVFLPTVLMGASFPLITSLAFRPGKEGDTVGKVYFFNVIGNVTGGLCTGLLLLGWIGTEYTIVTLSLVGLLFLFFARDTRPFFTLRSKTVLLTVILALIALFFPRKYQLYDRIHPVMYGNDERKIISEGVDAVIVTYSEEERLKTYISGMSHGGRPIPIFYYEAIEAISHQKQLEHVLVIGFGTGSTVETILKAEPAPKITLVELSEVLIDNLQRVDYLNAFLKHDNVNLVYADGRKFLYNSNEKYDAVFIDPLRTTTSFSNNLFSREFFQLIEHHLAPGGVLMTWTDEYHIVPKTICSVFPYVKQYSFFCLSSNSELNVDHDYEQKLFEMFPEHKTALLRIDSLESNPLSREEIMAINTKYPINEDYKPWCEYFIGLRLRNLK